jgi:K(+)-stimulated pyrophosphate-energized sodium pump
MMDGTHLVLLTAVPVAGILGIIAAIYLYFFVKGKDSGTRRMKEVATAIEEGSAAYLKREYMVLAVFVGIMAVLISYLLDSQLIGAAYILGSASSALAGWFGMHVAVKANVKSANAARKGLNQAFPIAFYGGAVMGLSIVGLALIGTSLLYYVFGDLNIVLGFSFGASATALFAKAGGGIFTKTADIGADLVGKVEAGIPEDDPRNPAVIADNVGDNVGDVAGMGSDLIDSYIAALLAAMVLGAAVADQYGLIAITLPLILAAVGSIASIIGLFFVRVGEKGNPGAALNRGTFATTGIFALMSYVLFYFMGWDINIFYATLAGLVAGVIIGITTDFFTSIDRKPVKITAEASKTGSAITILSGFSYGILSIIPPIIGIAIAMIVSWNFAGIYGVAMAAVGMLSIVGMIISSDAYGPIVDNSRGIAEQAGLSKKVIAITDKLDAAGNTAKAITKGFAIGAAALTVLSLFAAYAELVGIDSINIMDPYVMAGVFIGAMMPPILSAMLILSVSKNAFVMIEEVRRQFREIPGLLKGKKGVKADYARCVDIATKGAIKELILPGVLSIVVPVVVGLLLGKSALGGFLGGSIITGIIFALFMSNSGGTWDNAKKYIEEGHHGGKGSEAHKAAVVGDTVGDPFKDTAGPSLNTMITVMSLSASIFAPLVLEYALVAT